jgi:glyoxylase-like metal-dependent hydrolase (beta-lactamase superfamily II)
MIRIGQFSITCINDATTHVDAGGAFGLVPRALWQRLLPPDEDNLVPMSQLCLYVEAHGRRIIVDTGMGTRLTDRQRRFWRVQNEGGLLRGLAALGIMPEQIDLVINTHLHSDHCGGNTRWLSAEDHTIVPTFPNAEYVVQRQEYEDAAHPNERTAATYIAENFEPLRASGQLRLLEGDTELLPGVVGMVTPGHTPGHMSVAFHDGGETALFVCDLASYAIHFERLAWMTAYDVEPLRTLETKRRMQQWALDHDATLIFVHDTQRPVGKLRRGESSVYVEPLDVRWLE